MNDLLSLEEYVNALVHIEHYGDEHAEEVRYRLGIDEAVWVPTTLHWVDAISKDTDTKERTTIEQFAKVQAASKKKLEDNPRPLKELGERPDEAAPDVSADANHDDGDQQANISHADTAAHAIAEAAAEPPDAPPMVGGPPQLGSSALPIAPRPTVGARGAPPMQPPLGAVAPVAPPAIVPTPAVVSPPAAALPPIEVAAPPAAASPAAPKLPINVDETAFVDGVVLTDILPFDNDDGGSSAKQELSNFVAQQAMAGGMTAEVPVILIDDNSTLPFVDISILQQDEEIRTRLTLEQYVSLCAELDVAGQSNTAQRGVVLHRYGLDEASCTRMTKLWTKHFASDTNEKAKFDHLFQQYRAWLAQNR